MINKIQFLPNWQFLKPYPSKTKTKKISLNFICMPLKTLNIILRVKNCKFLSHRVNTVVSFK